MVGLAGLVSVRPFLFLFFSFFTDYNSVDCLSSYNMYNTGEVVGQ
jgi:hypothetical protein